VHSHLLCAALFVSALPIPAHAWAPTATRAIVPLNLAPLGPVPATTPIHITVSLNLRNREQLDAYLAAIGTPGNPLYNTRLTGEQFVAAYGPTASQAQAVAQYLTSQGFGQIEIAPNRLLIGATGSAQAVESAFNTKLLRYRVDDRTAFANSADAQVPDALGGIVVAVLGLQTLEAYHTHATPAAFKSVAGYSPWAFQQAYHVGSVPWAANIRIAIFTEGDMNPVISDLRRYESHFGLPQVPVAVIRGAGSSDTSALEEWDLDTQAATGLAHNVAQLRLYAADSMLDADLIPNFNRFVVDNLARAGSASFGLCEAFSSQAGAVASEDLVFAQAVAQGQTIFAGSGDAGSGCAIPFARPGPSTNGIPLAGVPLMVEMPAASPYVVGVGGTTLLVDASYNRSQEVAWSAGGGGMSVLEHAPAWQKHFVSPLAAIGRGVPDIAMDADPNTGAIIFWNGVEKDGVGGTSLSAPLALGAWARILQAHGGALGFAAPIFYGLHPTTSLPATPTVDVTGFHDILVGCNGFYCATPKWDYVTGLGTPDIETLSQLIH
jgi:subtilase family serine protease